MTKKHIKGKFHRELMQEKRKELKLTQQELGEKVGLSLNSIKYIETNRMNPNKENLIKIADALGLNIDELFIENYKETKILSIANHRGGCGKTSMTGCLGYSLTQLGYKVLLIDGDMKMNLTHSLGLDRNEDKNLYKALVEEDDISNYIENTNYKDLDIVISDYRMSTMEMKLFAKRVRETIFRNMIANLKQKGKYDFIIIDTNPTLGLLNTNLLAASDYVFIPVELSKFGVEGLDILLDFIENTRKINADLKIGGVVFNKVDVREKTIQALKDILLDIFGDMIMEEYISVDAQIKKSQWEGVPLAEFNNRSRSVKQYKELAKGVIKIVK